MIVSLAALSRRRARLRATALPTLRLAVKPIRKATSRPTESTGPADGLPSVECLRACRISPGATNFRPLAATARNSWRRFNLASCAKGGSNGLSAEALAALGATRRDDFSATHSRHAGAEAMPALADEHTGLVGALHD